MEPDYDVRAVYNHLIDGLDVYLIKRRGDGYIRWVEYGFGAEHTEPDDGARPADTVRPAFQLPRGMAQKLIEALAREGMQPEPDAKLKGQLEATQYHLEDLRTLLKLRPDTES